MAGYGLSVGRWQLVVAWLRNGECCSDTLGWGKNWSSFVDLSLSILDVMSNLGILSVAIDGSLDLSTLSLCVHYHHLYSTNIMLHRNRAFHQQTFFLEHQPQSKSQLFSRSWMSQDCLLLSLFWYERYQDTFQKLYSYILQCISNIYKEDKLNYLLCFPNSLFNTHTSSSLSAQT